MGEQLERGTDEQRKREKQTKRGEQRRGEERRKREREWRVHQEREKRLGRKRERRQEVRSVEWERRREKRSCHKFRGFGRIRTQCPTRRGPVVPHHQQEKQSADQAKEVIVNNYHFHASLDNLRFTLPRGQLVTFNLCPGFLHFFQEFCKKWGKIGLFVLQMKHIPTCCM